MHKTCSLCRLIKPASDFSRCTSRRDGLQRTCKPCNILQYHERKSDPEKAAETRVYRIAYYAEHRKDPAWLRSRREIGRKRREDNREAVRAYDNARLVKRKSADLPPKPRSDNAERVRARWLCRNAVNAGRLVRPKFCPKCGSSVRIQGHHKDYSKPFEVEWMCSICHGKEHRIPD